MAVLQNGARVLQMRSLGDEMMQETKP
ncbi:hypothetical protein NB311A_18266 [Nitrobacter sp. Nb-311A]|nr:hypothetical protein NB311A_18266 [Nitrobacter sp. Nb-311A]